MHDDPLISGRGKKRVGWGHDGVVLCLNIIHPWLAPTKVFALPIAGRPYINHQGLTKGKNGKGRSSRCRTQRKVRPDPDHRTRTEWAPGLVRLGANWFPDDKITMLSDSAYGGRSILSHLPSNVDLISRVAADAAPCDVAPPKQPGRGGRPRRKGDRRRAGPLYPAPGSKDA